MAEQKSPAQAAFDEVVAQAVTPVLKTASFRKSGMNYHRRVAGVVQVINLQTSRGATRNARSFFVNVGIAFDDLCRLTNVEVLEKPREFECDGRGTRGRLESLISGCPDEWSVGNGSSGDIILDLKNKLSDLVVELQTINSIQAYRQHRWFDRFRPTDENAQIMYALGDLDGAWAEVCDLCKLFADRQNANQPRWWIAKLSCSELSARL